MKQNETKKVQKSSEKFRCEKCDYNTCRMSQYERHLLTPKHKNETNETNLKQKSSEKFQGYFCNCGVFFNSRTTLWRHKKKCLNDCENILKDENMNKELMTLLVKENSDLKNMVFDLYQKMEPISNNINSNNINSNNKTFNLNLFLNDHCKDAMNIMDFVDSLKIQLSDLESLGKIGFVDGISNIIVKNLNLLDEKKRPIHCTDAKREVLYVKDEGKWYNDSKEEENKKIRKAIKHIAHKNSKLIPEFREKYPDCGKSDSKYSDQYNKLIIEAMGGQGDNDLEKEDKIIKNITKEVVIDKINY
jgi:hypothetical protein